MSGVILQFTRARKGQPECGEKVKAPRYCCTTCEADIFKLHSDGAVYCASASCGRFIANLQVTK